MRVSVVEHLDLARRARAPVGVAAFGRARHEAAVDVEQQRFAEAGAGGNHRGVAARLRDALLQHRELRRLEHRHRVGHRLEIVEDVDAAQRRAASAIAAASTSHGTLVRRAT